MSEWQQTCLGEFFQIKHGYAFQSEFFAESGKYIVLTPGYFYEEGGFKLYGSPKYYAGEIPQDYVLKRGDLLVAMTEQAPGLLGSPAFIPTEDEFLHNQRLGLVVQLNDNKLDKEFLFHILNSASVRKQVQATASGTKVKHTSPQRLYEVEILLPPLPEQRAIAAILSTWDEAITLTAALIDALKRRKAALMSLLLTGEVRFAEFLDVWESRRLGDVFERVTRKNEIKNTNVLTISAQHGLISQTEFFNKIVAGEAVENYYLLERGEFAYNRSYSTGYPYGAVKRLEDYDKGILSTLYICFRLADSLQDSDFWTYFFESGALNRGIYLVAQEGARNHGLLNINLSDFFDICVQVPSLDEQERLAEFFRIHDGVMETVTEQHDKLKAQKRGLMQQLLTGAVRVKVE